MTKLYIWLGCILGSAVVYFSGLEAGKVVIRTVVDIGLAYLALYFFETYVDNREGKP